MAAPAIAHVIQVAAPVVMAVADSTLGISSMINDVKTVFDPHVNWTAKLMSVADLAINVAMDVDMVTGTGEGIRAAYVGIKSTVKLAGKEAEHAVIAESEHLAEKEVENTTKHEVEGAVEHSCNSFAADTPVATPTGAQPIGTLSVGDTVLAVDGANGKVIAEPVQHVFINHDDNLLDVTLTTSDPHTSPSTTKQQQADVAAHGSQAPPTDEILHTTTEHPFLTVELGWVNAQDLKPGEHVRRLDGTVGEVVGTQVVAGVAVRYNLTVANEHTYAVGTGLWVVHNTGTCIPYGSTPLSQAVQDARKSARDKAGNYASALLDDGSTIVGRSIGKGSAGFHAEEQLLADAQSQGKTIISLYSEFEPCASKCAAIVENIPEVTYSFFFNPPARTATTDVARQLAIREIFK